MNQKFFLSIITIVTTCFSSYLLAENINIYDKPQLNARKIGSINSETGLILIYAPKNNSWMKIGDPENGNVGWAKTIDLQPNTTKNYIFSEYIIRKKDKLPRLVITFGEPKPPTNKQIKEYSIKMLQRQKAIQKNIQGLMEEMFIEFNDFSNQFPFFTPVSLTPENTETPEKGKKNTNPLGPKKSS
ncbi:hypothetical protein N9L02_01185 [Gammaproteobacteria bacterium]|nr:hypothetical protein [Gammaproteobacteria bacterium]